MGDVEDLKRDSRRFFGPGARDNEVIAGRYRVIHELGAGGMGQVVEVEHLELEKRFALKLIRPDRWDDTLEARFRREAKALARVTSPRVAQITDFGVDEERGPFYVMELCEGEPLDVLIQREAALGTERALRIAIGIAKALADVHAAGIVHRDIKPGNIAISEGAAVEVRLMDFGLAASIDDRFGSRMTESKRVVGSMPYMAPEQFHGERPTIGMDIWALGIVLYEMTTGRLPFDAPSTAALIHRILNERVPFRGIAPAAFSPLFDRLLEKDAALRCPTATAAIELLERGVDEREASSDTAEATRIEPSGPKVEPFAATAEVDAPRRLPWGTRRLVTVLLSIMVIATVGTILVFEHNRPVRAVPLEEDPEASVPGGEVPVQAVRALEVTIEPENPVAIGVDPPGVETPPVSPEEATEEATGEETAVVENRRPPRNANHVARATAPAVEEAGEVETPPDPPVPTWTGGIIESRRP